MNVTFRVMPIIFPLEDALKQLEWWQEEHAKLRLDYEALLRRFHEVLGERDGYKGAMQNLAIRLSECEGEGRGDVE